MDIFNKHIEMVEATNNAKTQIEHDMSYWKLIGFREALHLTSRSHQLMECDMYYIDKGIDRPMCCGVFLDWEPEQEDAS